ncbi:MAG: hypothetical protein OEV06_03770 [Anaerolineae bacterium]|nr:hypothetical protein [Anaerolineae bacterium]
MNNIVLIVLLACLAIPLFSFLLIVLALLFGKADLLSHLPQTDRIRREIDTMSRLRDSAVNPWKKDQDQYNELASLVEELDEQD